TAAPSIPETWLPVGGIGLGETLGDSLQGASAATLITGAASLAHGSGVLQSSSVDTVSFVGHGEQSSSVEALSFVGHGVQSSSAAIATVVHGGGTQSPFSSTTFGAWHGGMQSPFWSRVAPSVHGGTHLPFTTSFGLSHVGWVDGVPEQRPLR